MSDRAARILAVDDVPENVRLLEAVLEAPGYDIVSATTGQAALERRCLGEARSRAARPDDAAARRVRRL